MIDVFEKIKEWFSGSKRDNVPLIHEVIERSEEEILAYSNWKNSERKTYILSLFKNMADAKNDPDSRIQFINSASSRGFVAQFESAIFHPEDFQHFFDYLKERVLEHGYLEYMSDARSILKDDIVIFKERHYLKPKLILDAEGKADQRFGNITIEYIKHDDQPMHLKFVSHIYSDSKFQDALPLQHLWPGVFS